MSVFSMVFIKPQQNRIYLVVKDAKDLQEAVLFSQIEIEKTGERAQDWQMVVSNKWPLPEARVEETPAPLVLQVAPDTKETKKDLSFKNKLIKTILDDKNGRLLIMVRHLFNQNELNFLNEEIKK
ncbi:MAG TPA: hypothetical protein DIT25_03900 [Candidatus Moranbacteria bacterium]|nr:hypothetical protein [Candidatus Moranbacteria bacterium]